MQTAPATPRSNGTLQFLYDPEGRVCAERGATVAGITPMVQYVYDAEGRRVAKGRIAAFSCDSTANGFQLDKQYLLGPSGEQLTELNGDGSWAHTNVYAAGSLIATFDNDGKGAHFHLTDWLGTRRAQTDYTGKLEATYSSLPFGDGLASTGAVDPTEHHFTGKERDTESGLDYFGARYYSSNMGRFSSPDWSSRPEAVPYANLDDPQSLNLYAYAGNNPLSRRDLDGHCWSWLQGACNFVQELGNKIVGNGWNTNAQVRANRRDYVSRQQQTDEQRAYVQQMSDKQVNVMYKYYTDSDFNARINALAQVTVLPDGFQKDMTGRIHGELPDRIPDNWTREELEHARDELQESIKARIKETEDFGGPNAGHMERIRQEQQLLRQVEGKLGGK